jgi:hypothetical protein
VRALYELYVQLLNMGFLLTPTGFGALSTVTSEADIDRFAEAVATGLRLTAPMVAAG